VEITQTKFGKTQFEEKIESLRMESFQDDLRKEQEKEKALAGKQGSGMTGPGSDDENPILKAFKKTGSKRPTVVAKPEKFK
jgi:hypothetical protein